MIQVAAEPQPHWLAWVIPSTSTIRDAVTSTAPGASNVFVRRSRLSITQSGVKMSATMPTGMLTKKIHSQLSRSVRMPPKRTPAAAPKPPVAPHTPSAMLRSRPSAKVAVRIASAAGDSIAAPNPCRLRATIRESSDHDSPASNEAVVKMTIPARNRRRRPSRSPSLPPSSRNPPNMRA